MSLKEYLKNKKNDQIIEEERNGFPIGTHREEVWDCFEETYGISVTKDLMRL